MTKLAEWIMVLANLCACSSWSGDTVWMTAGKGLCGPALLLPRWQRVWPGEHHYWLLVMYHA